MRLSKLTYTADTTGRRHALITCNSQHRRPVARSNLRAVTTGTKTKGGRRRADHEAVQSPVRRVRRQLGRRHRFGGTVGRAVGAVRGHVRRQGRGQCNRRSNWVLLTAPQVSATL